MHLSHDMPALARIHAAPSVRSMRKFFVLMGLLFLPAGLCAADVRAVIAREAAKCAAAWQREDYAGILSYFPPIVIQHSGGRAALIAELKDQFAQARSFGAERLEATPHAPTSPKKIGRWLTSLVPVTGFLHSAHLDLTQETHVLALSSDGGKRWYFVVLYQTTPAELNAWFPELRGKVSIPLTPKPRMQLAY
jgi:hypothetical protein